MKIVGIVQARVTSTRLPGKVLKEVRGKPLLAYELERLAKIRPLGELAVATTVNGCDDPIEALCAGLNVPVYRGSERDVLSRYYEAAALFGADIVVRFTADCPLIDPKLSEEVISYYLTHRLSVDYCALDVSTYPRGMDTEIFSMRILEEAFREGRAEAEREHVTYFIWNRPSRYRLWHKKSERDWGKYRLTVDTAEDFALVREILERLSPEGMDFGLPDIVTLLESHPELAALNEGITQKPAESAEESSRRLGPEQLRRDRG